MAREVFVKGWQVFAKDEKGRERAVGRRYSNEQTAKTWATVLKGTNNAEYQEPVVRAIQGFEPDSMK